jgi:cytochrome c oxidase subunit 2
MAFHVDKLEKRWLWIIAALVVMTWAVQIYFAAVGNLHPPSNVEAVDSAQIHLASGIGGTEFAEDNIGISRDAHGKLVVRMVAARYGFYPQRIDIPQGEEFTLRVVSFDVLHGIYVPGTNLNLMIVPGYVSQVTTQLNKLGEVPYVCHEFCGPAHAYMFGLFNVVPKDEFVLVAASPGGNG